MHIFIEMQNKHSKYIENKWLNSNKIYSELKLKCTFWDKPKLVKEKKIW